MQSHQPFRRNTQLYFFVSLFFIALTLLRVARMPNIWSMTQNSWNYHFGFIKRGLFGEIYSWFTPALHYKTLFFVDYAIYALGVAGLMYVGYLAVKKVPQYAIFLSLFFISHAFAFYTNFVGYLDHLLVIAVLAIALLPARKPYLIAAGAVCVIAMLTHELFLILAVPVLVMRILIHWQTGESKTPILAWSGMGLLCIGLFLFLSAQLLPAEHVKAFTDDIAARADFTPRSDNIAVLHRTIGSNVAMNVMGGNTLQRIQELLTNNVPLYLPLIVLYCLLTVTFFPYAENKPYWHKIAIALVMVGATFTPLAASIMAWDYERFFSLSTIVAFIILVIVLRAHGKSAPVDRVHWLLAAAVLISMEAQQTRFMDDFKAVKFPYTERLEQIQRLRAGQPLFSNLPNQ